MSIEREFIPYEQALALKELGFDEECFAYYDISEKLAFKSCFNRKPILLSGKKCAIPTFSQAFRWFREKYNLIPNIHSIYEDETHTKIKFWFWFGNYEDDSDDEVFYGNYEEAELECLKKLISIVKNK